MAEFHRIGVASMFAAYPEFDVRASGSSLFHRNPHQIAYTFLVDRDEWVSLHDFQLSVMWQKRSAVITAHTQGGLSQIVRTETEELRCSGNLVSGQGASRHLDHGADEI